MKYELNCFFYLMHLSDGKRFNELLTKMGLLQKFSFNLQPLMVR